MEHTKNIIAWELLFIFVFAALLVIQSVDQNGLAITGRATAGITQEALRLQIEQTLPDFQFVNDVKDASLCLIVNFDSFTKYAYDIVKLGDAIAVTSSTGLCKGESNEDFILSYVSYDKLKQHLDNPPTLSQLKQVSDGTSFYLYPSKYVAAGGKLANADGFNTHYGSVVRKYLSSAELAAVFSGAPQLQQPSSFASYFFYFIIGLVVLIVVLGVFIFTHAKKPAIKENLEITSYIKSALSQGYEQTQVYEALLQGGWPQDQVDEAFRAVNAEVTLATQA